MCTGLAPPHPPTCTRLHRSGLAEWMRSNRLERKWLIREFSLSQAQLLGNVVEKNAPMITQDQYEDA